MGKGILFNPVCRLFINLRNRNPLLKKLEVGAVMYRSIVLLFMLACFLPSPGPCAEITNPIPFGKGSLPSRFFPDRKVCLIDAETPDICKKKLVRLPRPVLKAREVTFYGVFDLDGDGRRDGPVLFSRIKLPDSKYLSEPRFGGIPPSGSAVGLEYTRTLGCMPAGSEIKCEEEK
jgi:hypothetical protein